ncbi:MAG: U32 family peptidase, partial [Fibrobacter sp.]|nr:U32 family peptidase [Fibrobacter sp.]
SKARNKKVYIALNLMPYSSLLNQVEQTLWQIRNQACFPDAFIVSDPGVIMLCKEITPNVALHLSTQTGTFNHRALSFWKEQGISRAVLPRELSVAQITELTSKKIMETEIFVHGAMCVSISGRCLMGAYIGSRHPNFGDCSQPCRLKYKVAPIGSGEEDYGEWLQAEETERGLHLFNSRDLCCISILPKLIAAGVHSLKIEGRNKSIHYVASVVKTYRAALDAYIKNPENYTVSRAWIDELDSVEHRPYTTGFYENEMMLQEVYSSKAASTHRAIGTVKGVLEGGIPVIDIKNSFSADDELEVLPVQQSLSSYMIKFSHLTDLSGNYLKRAPSNRLVLGHGGVKLRSGDMLRMKL